VVSTVSAKPPTLWQAASWVLSVIVAVIGTHVATKATTEPTTPAPAVTISVVPEASSVDRLVEAAKGRPGLIDDFEVASRKLASDARAKLKP
jgi:hypothetical protein